MIVARPGKTLSPALFNVLRIIALVVSIAGAVLLFAWDRLVGLPAWLKSLGLLDWLNGLSPLDKWITTAGAIFIGTYAVFHETMLAWLRRPKLKVRFENHAPYIIAMPLRITRTTVVSGTIANVPRICPSFQIRLVVSNVGASRAEAVEVYAVRLLRKENERFAEVSWFLPMSLIWANDETTQAGISTAVERTCNIAGIMKPSDLNAPDDLVPHAPEHFDYKSQCVLRLHTAVTTTSYSNHLYPGQYRLDLVVSAANASSVSLSVYLSFSGQWFDDQVRMFSEAVTVLAHDSPEFVD